MIVYLHKNDKNEEIWLSVVNEIVEHVQLFYFLTDGSSFETTRHYCYKVLLEEKHIQKLNIYYLLVFSELCFKKWMIWMAIPWLKIDNSHKIKDSACILILSLSQIHIIYQSKIAE